MIFLTLVMVGLVFMYIWESSRRKDFPPGPFSLPFLGNIPQLAIWSRQEPHNHIMLQNFSKQYGPIASFKFGLIDQVVIDDPQIIRDILQSDSWINRPVIEYLNERSEGKSSGLVWSNGDLHKELRRFTLRNLRDFGFGKQNSQEAIMEAELKELFGTLDKKLEADGNLVEMGQFFTLTVLNIIWCMVAGFRFAHDDPKFQKMVWMNNQSTRLLSASGNIMVAFPFLRHILPKLTGYGKTRKEILAQMRNFFLDILKERRESGQYKVDQNDFIDVFIRELDKHENNHGDPMSVIYNELQFNATLMDLFVAGSETTSSTLEFAVLFMMLHPDVQEKVHKEIDDVLGKDTFPQLAFKQKMPYTEATLLEILRLSSVVPITGRTPIRDVKIGNYTIPKGTFTALNIYSAQINPKVWDCPKEFKPERFLDSGKIVNADKIINFGGGKRSCLGEILARATLFTYFVAFMQKYKVALPENLPKPSLEGVTGVTIVPEPFSAVIHPR